MAITNSVFSVHASNSGFAIHRDGKPIKSPAGHEVIVPAEALASAMCEEIRSQGEKPDLRKMPLTQLTFTALDLADSQRTNIIDGLMRLGETELVCQRASDPPALVEEQNRIWEPYLGWCQERFGAALRTGCGIVPFEQDKKALAALRRFIETFDAFYLAGVSEACSVAGSLLLGLALATRKADAKAIFEAAELDNLWQSRKWGDDPVSAARQADIRRDLEVCATWFGCLSNSWIGSRAGTSEVER